MSSLARPDLPTDRAPLYVYTYICKAPLHTEFSTLFSLNARANFRVISNSEEATLAVVKILLSHSRVDMSRLSEMRGRAIPLCRYDSSWDVRAASGRNSEFHFTIGTLRVFCKTERSKGRERKNSRGRKVSFVSRKIHSSSSGYLSLAMNFCDYGKVRERAVDKYSSPYRPRQRVKIVKIANTKKQRRSVLERPGHSRGKFVCRAHTHISQPPPGAIATGKKCLEREQQQQQHAMSSP